MDDPGEYLNPLEESIQCDLCGKPLDVGDIGNISLVPQQLGWSVGIQPEDYIDMGTGWAHTCRTCMGDFAVEYESEEKEEEDDQSWLCETTRPE